jgi:hypothetical protein
MAAFALIGAGLVFRARQGLTGFRPVSPDHGSVELVGRELFTRQLVPFELTTALLIVAVVGAIAVARSHERESKAPAKRLPPQRLFHGPLHPRDAGHPLTKERA